MGAEGIWILTRAAPSLRNWIQCSYFYANSLANERELCLQTPQQDSWKPTGFEIHSILVIYLKGREIQEANRALELLFFHPTMAGVDQQMF